MQYVLYDDFKPGVLKDGKVYDISAMLGGAAKRGGRAIVEAIIAQNAEIAGSGKAFSGAGVDAGHGIVAVALGRSEPVAVGVERVRIDRVAAAAVFESVVAETRPGGTVD